MGLAPYGKPTEPVPYHWVDNDIVSDIYNNFDEDDIVKNASSNINRYSRLTGGWLIKNCFPYRYSTGEDNDIMYYQNLASSIQNCFNDIMFNVWK